MYMMINNWPQPGFISRKQLSASNQINQYIKPIQSVEQFQIGETGKQPIHNDHLADPIFKTSIFFLKKKRLEHNEAVCTD